MLEIAPRILQSAFAIFGALYLVTGILAPSWFLDNISVSKFEIAGAPKWRGVIQLVAAIIGIGVLSYAATYAIISAVPYSWGGYDEDGEWEPLRITLQVIGSIVGPLMFIPKIEDVADALARKKIEILARKSLISTMQSSPMLPNDISQIAVRNLKLDLLNSDIHISNWSRHSAREIVSEVSLEIRRGQADGVYD